MNHTPASRAEAVLALVIDEARNLQIAVATQAQGCDELDGLVVDLRAAIRGKPGEGVKERKAKVASVAIRLAALAVRFVLDLRLDRYLDPEPVPEGYTPIEGGMPKCQGSNRRPENALLPGSLLGRTDLRRDEP